MAELQLRQEVLRPRSVLIPLQITPGGGAPGPEAGWRSSSSARKYCGTEAYLFPFKSLPELELLDPRQGGGAPAPPGSTAAPKRTYSPSNHSRSWSSWTRGQGGGAPAPPGSTSAPKRTYSPSNHSRSWSSWTRGRVAELQLRPGSTSAPKRNYSPSNHSRSWSSWTRGRVAELQLRPEVLRHRSVLIPLQITPGAGAPGPEVGWRSSSSARKHFGTEAYLFPF